jgi:Kdo2-lipid IVA lauroyltransferase/acyltransferase
VKALQSAVLNEIGYLAVRGVSGAVGAMDPGAAVRTARRVGRAYALSPINRKRFDRAVSQIGFGFPEWEAERVRDCAIASFENLACLGADMALIPRLLTADGWTHYVSTRNISPTVRTLIESKPSVLITCHCGNFEVLGYTVALLGFPMHALYRPFDSVSLDNYMRRTRSARGMTLVDKFGAVHRLPGLVEAGAPIGFVADQNGGDRGVQTPFFGRLASTYKSIGLLAMQFDANIVCGYARRTGGVGRAGFGYEMTVNDVFGPNEWSTHPDPLFYLTARYRWAIERIVRESPGQYFWMHRIWRSRPRHERLGRPFPESLREKIRLLPWMTDEVLDQVVEQSGIDAATLKRTGQSRLN